ncbi:MAB_1171c family putative transporter [Nocardia altamirensis]|uniref:MAB_1171c family putative transporter n=1 Tax=Nocardia altamirensis TaxID=472158 RepID=UPI00084066ED|nr:MAB_1171c family putative transporter [Nocardia altamirensis]
MTAIPYWIVIPAVVLAITVVVGRWVLVNDTAMDRRINRGLTWYVVAMVLYGSIAALDMDDLAERLFLGCGVMIGVNVVGFARTLNGGDAHTEPRGQRWYDLIAAVVAVTVLVGPAWVFPTVWVAFEVLMVFSAVLIARACIRDLRVEGGTPAEKMAYSCLLIVVIYWMCSGTLVIVRALSGIAPQDPGIAWVVMASASFVVLAALIAVPVVIALAARMGWDRNGRACRRLRPLWLDLTSVVPEVVLRQERPREPGSRLYRMTVEIRDAVLHLSRHHLPDPGVGHDLRAMTVSAYALWLAHAVQSKADGNAAVVDPARAVPLPDTRDHTTELRSLLRLAREWPTARARAAALATR